MSDAAAKEARRGLQRLRRAVEKAAHELGDVEGALRHVEGEDFPAESYARAADQLGAVLELIDEESARLEEKVLYAGGLEPGRVRRTGGG